MTDFILEFSASQKAFGIYPLKDILERNLKNSLRRKKTDYIPIYSGSREDCELVMKSFKETMGIP